MNYFPATNTSVNSMSTLPSHMTHNDNTTADDVEKERYQSSMINNNGEVTIEPTSPELPEMRKIQESIAEGNKSVTNTMQRYDMYEPNTVINTEDKIIEKKKRKSSVIKKGVTTTEGRRSLLVENVNENEEKENENDHIKKIAHRLKNEKKEKRKSKSKSKTKTGRKSKSPSPDTQG